MDHAALPQQATLWTRRTLATTVLSVGQQDQDQPWTWPRIPGEGRKRLNDTGSGSTGLIVQDGLPVVFISHLSDFPGLIAPSSQAHSQPRMRKDSAAGFFSSHCTYRHRPGSCGVTMTSRRWIMARKILGDKTLPFSSTLMCQPPVSC